jgi:hypothetical protein
MKNSKFNYSIAVLIAIVTLIAGCDRNLDELPLATNYSTTPEVFIDGFSAGLDYAAWGKVTNFNLDYAEKYSGTASMKFDVPNFGDPNGNAAGGVFHTSIARDLSSYNVLTFWAKASQVDTITKVGFGSSQLKGVSSEIYKVTLNNLVVTTTWTKYYIPIPDASKLKNEKGMFYYWADPKNGGKGFTFWIDELKFENLGTITHTNVGTIYSGKDMIYNNIETGEYQVPSLSATFNLPTGINQSIDFPSSYLTLTSSNPTVAAVNKPGVYTIINKGSTLITAKLGENYVKGSLLINSIGAPVLPTISATIPSVASSNVISLFSNAYTNSKVDTWNPYYSGSTAVNIDIKINGTDDVIRYRYLNWVCILFQSVPINATAMTNIHIDVWTPDVTTNKFVLKIHDYATDSEGVYTYPTALMANQWNSLDIPLSSFVGLTGKTKLGMVILASSPDASNLNVYVDNIYLHK